jgi:hypothetical protein
MKNKPFLFGPSRFLVVLLAAVGTSLYLTSELDANASLEPKEPGRRFYIGQTSLEPSRQKETVYSIEYEQFQSDNGANFQLKDHGAFCYGKNDPCFQWVGQTLTGTADAQTGQIPVWEYGIEFFPPNGKDMTATVFTNVAGLKNPTTNKLTLVVPNFLQGGGVTAVGSWSEAVFQVSAVQRLKIRARLVHGTVNPTPPPGASATPTAGGTPTTIGTPIAR